LFFFGNVNIFKSYLIPNESSFFMTISMSILMFSSIFFGYFFNELFIGLGSFM